MKRFISRAAMLMCVATLLMAALSVLPSANTARAQNAAQTQDPAQTQDDKAADAAPDAAQRERPDRRGEPTARRWGLTLGEVPDLLRMHIPMLPPGSGYVVEGVEPTGPAARVGVRTGDLLVEIDGRPVGGKHKLGRLNDRSTVIVVRRGMPQSLSVGRPAMPGMRPMQNMQAMQNMRPMQPMPNMRPMQSRPPSGTGRNFGGGTMAFSSSSSGNAEAVSISRNGDQITLDISSSEPAVGKIKLSGTMAEIERELQGDSFSPEAKAAVRKALRGNQ